MSLLLPLGQFGLRRVGGVAGNTYASAVLADSPTFYYRCQETSGFALEDATSNNLDGVISGAFTLNQPGFVAAGKSIQLAGTNSDIAAPSFNTSASGWACECIINITGNGTPDGSNLCAIMGNLDSTGKFGFEVDYRTTDGKLIFYVANNNAFGVEDVSSVAVSQNTELHVACEYASGTKTVMVNGTTILSTASAVNGSTTPGIIRFGKRSGSASRFLQARISECAYYATSPGLARLAAHAAAAAAT